jgi:hypothetical protein
MEPTVSPSDPVLDAVRTRRISLRASMGNVEIALAAPATGRTVVWNEGVRSAVQDLQSCMHEHVQATEGPAGFHREILTAAPRLAHAVAVSVREHAVIVQLIADVLARGQETRTQKDTDTIRELGTNLLARISRHRQRGADMIYEAYESDLGGEN